MTLSDPRAYPEEPAGRARAWVAVGWAAATLLVGAALLFPVIVQRAPGLGGAGYSPGDSITSSAITRFDVWGVTATIGDPPSASLGFQPPGGPN